ncbi:hypothetical protein B0T19DRAFT_48872 [Cercophora scortea]|uniref:DUF1479-domain-containing protein n=1 Tax=Cercophora scortea TaxID=314031 RepID=A0AAE0J536_9PEZI|nr:hypothetical protein B0T19DRAFT_48872 [Cercophora scortea]
MAISTGSFSASSTVVTHIHPTKKHEMHSFSCPDPIALPRRFAVLKERFVSGSESALEFSWHRLVQKLQEEVDTISSAGSDVVPAIDFADIANPEHVDGFLDNLKKRGVAVIRNVVPRDTAMALRKEAIEYLDQNPQTKATPATDPQLYEIYWSPAQIKARAHPNVVAAQKFAMGVWKSRDPAAKVTANFPVTYADRVRIRTAATRTTPSAHVDGGSVERWEPDGYGGRAGPYKDIFQGSWEKYDPWESSGRIPINSDLYSGSASCSIFRMFQGWLALDTILPAEGSLQIVPMPKLATAYFLLRPFFSPPSSSSSGAGWTLAAPQTSILHGALPSYAQSINPALHPHLQLARSMVPVPRLEPGDYVVWHPDLAHSIDGPNHAARESVAMYIPACPLTQGSALYLCRQRKAFLRGYPGPDFGGCGGEKGFIGRAGVQEVDDAGGDEALRSMGLMPWDEEDADDDAEREVLAAANSILFPDLYDDLY